MTKSASNTMQTGEEKSTIINILKTYPYIILTIVVMLLYGSSIKFGITELDDTIFINELKSYNEQPSNFWHSFKRGVFHETNDTYYRPLLLNSFLVNHMLSETDVQGYHVFNLLMHLLAVLLLFKVFTMLGTDRVQAVLLTLLFAVHPVLTQAVVWIPGRNDTLLAVFVLSWMWMCLRYIQSGRALYLGLQFVCLMAALFTKETAVFAAPAFFVLCILMLNNFTWKSKPQLIMYATWVVAFLIWFSVRASATVKNDPIDIAGLLLNLPARSALAIQYLGKIILPFNLSVFPMQAQTTYWFGLAAIGILSLLLLLSKGFDKRKVIAGLLWFVLLLTPVFLLPASLNDQDFEHRLYLPIIGILILLGQTFIFNPAWLQKGMLVMLGVIVIFSGINFIHQQKFTDPITFWTSAVASTPKSSYAQMMLGARVYETDTASGRKIMVLAFQLNPNEKYVNYYLGKYYLNLNQTDTAAKYLQQELKGSSYYDTHFLLSRVYFLKQDIANSLTHMEQYLELDPGNPQANNNYILMLSENNQLEKAKQYIDKKQAEGMQLPSALVNSVNQRLLMQPSK